VSTNPADVPTSSGLYVVRVDTDDMRIDLDPRREATCLRVGRAHCKFGRARNLRARCGNYLKTFAGAEVTFKVLALVDDYKGAEARCNAALMQYRSRGPSGRLHEWLSGITPEGVAAIVERTLGHVDRLD
jgi:hypothetical protein